jgi:integrase
MATRRGNGGGSVYQRGSDGKWVASVVVGGRRISRYLASEKEARSALATMLDEARRQALTPPCRVTLAEWSKTWLSTIEMRPSSLRTCQQTLLPLVDILGPTRLDRLTPLLISQAIAKLRHEGRGPRRVQLGHTYLRQCLAAAVEAGMIPANPMLKVKKPRWEPGVKTYWTAEQAKQFLDTALTTHRKWGPLLAFLLTTGLRISEALALTWDDVDLPCRRVTIRKALVWAGSSRSVQTPKTRAGRRIVSLPTPATEVIGRVTGPRHGPLFLTDGGLPPRNEHLRDAITRLCAEAGVPRVHVHGLRHVHAMLALEATGDVYAVQRRLGHASVGVTTGIYGYSRRGDDDTAAALDGLLS